MRSFAERANTIEQEVPPGMLRYFLLGFLLLAVIGGGTAIAIILSAPPSDDEKTPSPPGGGTPSPPGGGTPPPPGGGTPPPIFFPPGGGSASSEALSFLEFFQVAPYGISAIFVVGTVFLTLVFMGLLGEKFGGGRPTSVGGIRDGRLRGTETSEESPEIVRDARLKKYVGVLSSGMLWMVICFLAMSVPAVVLYITLPSDDGSLKRIRYEASINALASIAVGGLLGVLIVILFRYLPLKRQILPPKDVEAERRIQDGFLSRFGQGKGRRQRKKAPFLKRARPFGKKSNVPGQPDGGTGGTDQSQTPGGNANNGNAKQGKTPFWGRARTFGPNRVSDTPAEDIGRDEGDIGTDGGDIGTDGGAPRSGADAFESELVESGALQVDGYNGEHEATLIQ